MRELKKKIEEKELIKLSKIEVSLAHQLGAVLFDYLIGFSNEEKITQTKAKCEEGVTPTNVRKLHDFLEWVTPMLKSVNGLRREYDAEAEREPQKAAILEASKALTRAQMEKPWKLHRSLGENLNKFIELAEAYEKKYGPIAKPKE